MALRNDEIDKITPRLAQAQNIWLATVRADSRPHLVPIWFVWADGKVWISTGRRSQKRVNIEQNPRVAVSLEDGTNPLVLEGSAQVFEDAATRDRLAPHFQAKYEWDFRTDEEYGTLIGITLEKLLLGGS